MHAFFTQGQSSAPVQRRTYREGEHPGQEDCRHDHKAHGRAARHCRFQLLPSQPCLSELAAKMLQRFPFSAL